MTREEAIECLNFQNEKFFGGQSEALKMAISALSTDGEYIRKSELLGKTVRRNSIWNEVTNSEGKGLEEIVNGLPTYSFPEELSEDGTLTVHVSDGSKVKRVFVTGDNIFGGLYYPDSAKTDTAKPEEGAELIDRRQIKWYGCDHEGHIKGIDCDTADCSKCFFATVEHDEVMSLPVCRIPDSAENKGEWIYKNYHWECSCCGGNPNYGTGFVPNAETMKERYKFCNLCGADMRGIKNGEWICD